MNVLTGPTVVVVGSINIDQVVTVKRHPHAGETLIGRSLGLQPGGKGANQAVAAALLGARVAMIGAVGEDSSAPLALSMLKSTGVDLDGVETVGLPTGLALITVDADGENTIVVVPGANSAGTAEAVRRRQQIIADAAVVVLQGEIPACGISAATELASGRVVLNLAPVIPLDPHVIRRADPLVVNEHEAALVLAQLESVGRVAETARDDIPDPSSHGNLVRRLRRCGIPSVVLTRGALGAIWSDGSGTASVASPEVAALDTSGAGDAFVGALSARLAFGETLGAAVAYAVRVGAFTVRSSGTQASYPSLADVLPQVQP